MLGRILVPEMQRRGYKYPISIGACMSGGLAMIIPPSALAVILVISAAVLLFILRLFASRNNVGF